MSYLVFARKWRPQTFEEIIGQQHVTTTLKNAISQNRVAHAYLFCGPRGVGKTTTARIFAKAINCQSDSPANQQVPCNKCRSCVEITEGRSLDVIEIDGASNRGIDEIRQLRENIKFGPSSGRFKVYIIDEVHQITPDAFNALLKTLEEPPAYVKFVFATTHRHKIIPTILSRCQRFDFRKVSTPELVDKLKNISRTEKLDIDPEALFAVARAADGSMRDAETLLDQLASFSSKRIRAADVIFLAGGIEQDTLLDIAKLIIDKDTASVLTAVNKFIDAGNDILQFTNSLIGHFRNLAIAKVTSAPSGLMDLSGDAIGRIVEQSRKLQLSEIIYTFNLLNNAQDLMRKSGFARIQLEMAIIRLINRDSIRAAAKETPKSVEVVPKRIARDNSAPDSSAMLEVPANKDNFQLKLEMVEKAWPDVLKRIKAEKISAALFLVEAKPCRIDGTCLVLVFPQQFVFYKEALERPEKRSMIERYLKERLGRDVKIKFEIVDEIFDKAPAREKILAEPVVKAALDVFGARIVERR